MSTDLKKVFLKKKKRGWQLAKRVVYYISKVEENTVANAGMAELADARDLKSREIFSRTGSTPASGTIYIAEWSSLAARRAHNPKVMRFKSHLRNQKSSVIP